MQATRTTAEHRWRCNPSPRGCGVETLPALRYPLAGAVWTTAPTRGPSELRQRGCAQRSAAARSHCAIAATRAEVGFARKVLTDGARLDNQRRDEVLLRPLEDRVQSPVAADPGCRPASKFGPRVACDH